MTLNIVTVAFEDSSDLAATYANCRALTDRAGDPAVETSHWIFVKKYDPSLAQRYPGAEVLPSHDTGIYNAMNLAFRHLKDRLPDDDLLLYLNAGDSLLAQPLAEHLRLHRDEGADLSLAGAQLSRKGRVTGVRSSPRNPASAGAIIFKHYPCHQATFYSVGFLKRAWARRGTLYVEDLRVCGDLELYLFAQGSKIVTSSWATSVYDIDGFSAGRPVSVANEKSHLVEAYRAGLSWRLYARYWQLRARLVGPKRALSKALGRRP
jgi:hypothetical protein